MTKKIIFPALVIIASIAVILIIKTITPSPVVESPEGRANTNDYIVYIKNEDSPEDEKEKEITPKQPSQSMENILSYQEAMLKYEGKRIQFNNCEATPKQITFANDTKIMLDGRSAEGQMITINGQSIVLGGYEFAFVTLKSDTLPSQLNIDCESLGNQLFNTAQIILQ
jgi:hypothetical protein